jgi:hypothetical protein
MRVATLRSHTARLFADFVPRLAPLSLFTPRAAFVATPLNAFIRNGRGGCPPSSVRSQWLMPVVHECVGTVFKRPREVAAMLILCPQKRMCRRVTASECATTVPCARIATLPR